MASGGGGEETKEKLSDQILDSVCHPCKKKNKQREAVKFCVECRKLYCESCLSQHNSLIDDHTLLDDVTQCSILRNQPTDRCLKHGGTIKMWCKSHDQVACTVCISIDHRSCDGIVFIPSDIDSILKQADVDQVKKDLVDVRGELEEIKEKKEVERTKLEKDLNASLQAVIDNREKINKILDKLDREANKTIKSQFEEVNTKIQKHIETLETAVKEIDKSLKQINASTENPSQLFVCMKKSQRQVTDHRSNIDDISASSMSSMLFKIDTSIEEFLANCNSLGDILDNSNTLYRMASMKEVNVRIRADTQTCNILHICQLDDRSFLLTDYGNNKLKRLDIPSCTVQDHYDFPAGRPIAVCRIGGNEVAVSLDNKTVSIVSTSPKLQTTRSIKLDHHCYGLAFSAGELFVSDGGKVMYVHTLEGKLLRKLGMDLNSDAFSANNHITFTSNENRDVMAVTDTNNSVIYMDKTGRRLAQYRGLELQHAYGVCTTGTGLTFISGYKSNNVIQIRLSGQSAEKVCEVVSPNDGIKYIRSLCFDEARCQLLVTNGDSDMVTLCKLSKDNRLKR